MKLKWTLLLSLFALASAIAEPTFLQHRRKAFRAAEVGTAVFDGTNDFMRLTASSVTGLADGNDVTLSCWVKFTGAGTSGNDAIISLCNSTGSATKLYIGRDAANNKLYVYGESTSTTVLYMQGATVIGNAGGWIHLYVCIDLTPATIASCKIYINGVAETIEAGSFYTSGATLDLVSGTNARFTIAGDGITAAGQLLQASLAEFWFDDTYLDDPSQFRTTDNHPKATLPASPVWYFKGSGNAFNVSSGTGANMTITGSLTTDPPGP